MVPIGGMVAGETLAEDCSATTGELLESSATRAAPYLLGDPKSIRLRIATTPKIYGWFALIGL